MCVCVFNAKRTSARYSGLSPPTMTHHKARAWRENKRDERAGDDTCRVSDPFVRLSVGWRRKNRPTGAVRRLAAVRGTRQWRNAPFASGVPSTGARRRGSANCRAASSMSRYCIERDSNPQTLCVGGDAAHVLCTVAAKLRWTGIPSRLTNPGPSSFLCCT